MDTLYKNLQLSLEIQSALNIIPEFYKDLVSIWQLLSHGEFHNIELTLSQNLWNNKCITRNSHSIVYVDLLSKGIQKFWIFMIRKVYLSHGNRYLRSFG